VVVSWLAEYAASATVTAKLARRAGQRTELSQTRPEEHAGTFDDPYIASGLILGGCYPFQ